MTEKLKLVTSFSQLRAGDLVVVKPCGHCGKTHRGMLVGEYYGTAKNPDGTWTTDPGWWLSPSPQGGTHGVVCHVISARGVARRIVYLVDTGLSREQTTEKAKTKERVR